MSKIDYDAWRCGWYDCEPTTHCKHCEDNEQKLDDVSEYFEEILEQLYGVKNLNKDTLQHCLSEIAYFLKIKFKGGDLKIQEKKEVVPLHAWIEFNNSYLKSLTQKECV